MDTAIKDQAVEESSGTDRNFPYSNPTANLKRKLGNLTDTDEHNTPIKRRRNGRQARKECVICCDDVAINHFPKLPHETADTHDRGVCFKCWETHLISEIASKGWNAVACPQCAEVLSEPELRKIASGKTYEKYKCDCVPGRSSSALD